MRVLLLGGAGYIGSHMAALLSEQGIDFVTYDRKKRNYLFAHERQIQGDVADINLLESLFAEEQFDAILHFAASIEVAESCEKPLLYYENNTINMLRLLRLMLKYGVNKLVFSSTAAIYGSPVLIPIPEDHQFMPLNPYGQSKAMAETFLQDAARAYGINSISLRYFNAAGADPLGRIGECHEPETHVIPILLEVAAEKRKIFTIYGNDYETRDGTCIRDYVHVVDICRAHWLALNALMQGAETTAYNVGTGEGCSINELIHVAEKVTNKKINRIYSGRRVGDPAVLVANTVKIQKELSWMPVCSSLEKIILDAWRWHRSQW